MKIETQTSEYELTIDLKTNEFVLKKTKIKKDCSSRVKPGEVFRGNVMETDRAGNLYLIKRDPDGENFVIKTSPIVKTS